MAERSAGNIFIDTNMYRVLFLTPEYEEKIFPIIKKLSEAGYKILMPQQVLDEINRNRYSAWADSTNNNKLTELEKVKEYLNKPALADLTHTKPLLGQVIKKINLLNKQHGTTQRNLFSSRGKSSKLVKKLMDIVEIIPDSREVFDATQLRAIKGNPPFDSNSKCEKNCDRYIWESILSYFNQEGVNKPVLYFFTQNYNDWCIGNKPYYFHPMLKCEFKIKTKGEIIWSNKLEDLPSISTEDRQFVKDGEDSLEKVDIARIKEYAFKDYEPVPNFISYERMRRLKEYVQDLMIGLSPREQKILEMRYGLADGIAHSLCEVGQEFDIPSEMVSQIEMQALEKIKSLSCHQAS